MAREDLSPRSRDAWWGEWTGVAGPEGTGTPPVDRQGARTGVSSALTGLGGDGRVSGDPGFAQVLREAARAVVEEFLLE